MPQASRQITILLADDDPDDRLLCKKALQESNPNIRLQFVEDGDELMNYLRRRETFADAAHFPSPNLILLDLNMPRKDGREALKEIKSDPDLRRIPIVVLTTSKAGADIFDSYDLGVNSFVTKPLTFNGLVEVMRILSRYWFEVVECPNRAQ